MDFKKATDELQSCPTHEEIADALGVKLPTVRQARLDKHAAAHRTAPAGWRPIIAKLAEVRAKRLLRLAEKLRNETAD